VPEYCFNIYHDKEYREKDIDVEICEAVVKAGTDTDHLKFKKIKAVEAASLLHKGPYEGLREAYGFLIKWLEENGYEATDNFRESYIDGCWNRDNPADWLTEIQVPIKKK
jgi:effector-binding domain-containing protein